MLYTNVLFVSLVLLWPVTVFSQRNDVRASCPCPQKSIGWLLFKDENRSVPDFWNEDSVYVEEIYECSHGVNVLFTANQDGESRCVALIFVRPSIELVRTRVIFRSCDSSRERKLAWLEERYAMLRSGLENIFGPMGTNVLDFRGRPKRPTIVPGAGLILRWEGRELKLRGNIDVYMSMIN